jgi:hypothetical protein
MEIMLPAGSKGRCQVPLAQFLLDKLRTKYRRNTIFSMKKLWTNRKNTLDEYQEEMENQIERTVILM